MADLFAIFNILLFLGIVFPGLMTTVWLLFPKRVGIAQARLEHTPWKSLLVGLFLLGGLVLPVAILLALPAAPAKFLGWSLLFLGLTAGSLGASGLSALLGSAINRQTQGKLSPAGAFLRGALALELAAAFPIVGWFVVIPLSLIACLGATFFAVLNWSAASKPTNEKTPEQPTMAPAPASVQA